MSDIDAWFEDGDADALSRIQPPEPKKPMGMRVIQGGRTTTPSPAYIAPTPTAFEWVDPKAIAPRQWTYGFHLCRKAVGVTVAPGGAGKTGLTQAETLAMVTGKPLLGTFVPKPIKVWSMNLEDPFDELQRSYAAAMMHYNIAPADVEGRLWLDSGRDQGLCLTTETRKGACTINGPVVEALAAVIIERGIDHLTVDPFISSHGAPENDNNAQDMVAKEWGRLADRCNISIELVHHTRKPSGQELTVNDARGASALMDASRSGRVLNTADQGMRDAIGVEAGDKRSYFSVTDGKTSKSMVGGKFWYRSTGVELGNGDADYPNGDNVRVVERYEPKDPFEGITNADTLRVQRAVDALQYPRESAQSPDWVGYAIADALGWDIASKKQSIKLLIKTWQSAGVFKPADGKDKNSKDVPFLVVDEWINDLSTTSETVVETGGEVVG